MPAKSADYNAALRVDITRHFATNKHLIVTLQLSTGVVRIQNRYAPEFQMQFSAAKFADLYRAYKSSLVTDASAPAELEISQLFLHTWIPADPWHYISHFTFSKCLAIAIMAPVFPSFGDSRTRVFVHTSSGSRRFPYEPQGQPFFSFDAECVAALWEFHSANWPEHRQQYQDERPQLCYSHKPQPQANKRPRLL